MDYSYKGKNNEFSEEELNQSFSWPNAQIGEEMARANGFVNERHGGFSNGELSEEELDNVRADRQPFYPGFDSNMEEEAIPRRGRR